MIVGKKRRIAHVFGNPGVPWSRSGIEHLAEPGEQRGV
jgi:hypothetical protein